MENPGVNPGWRVLKMADPVFGGVFFAKPKGNTLENGSLV